MIEIYCDKCGDKIPKGESPEDMRGEATTGDIKVCFTVKGDYCWTCGKRVKLWVIYGILRGLERGAGKEYITRELIAQLTAGLDEVELKAKLKGREK